MEIRIAGLVPESVVDGPGIRFVVFTQGCPHGCPDCHNPQTHDFQGGEERKTGQILDDFQATPMVSGITISGGEPFCQPRQCAQLARKVKALGKHVLVFSGYTFEALLEKGRREPAVEELLSYTDVLIEGPYLKEKRDLNLAFRGSANQRMIDLPKSLAAGCAVEIAI